MKKEPEILLRNITLNWLSQFTKKYLKKEYAESTIVKQISLIKRLLRDANINDVEIDMRALSFKPPKQTSISHHLNEEEIQKIFDLKGLSESLENTRRLFLIGCTTGLRHSDLMNIKTYQIENDMMTLTTIKTGQSIMIPIEKRVLDFIPTIKPLSNAVFNRSIKDLCRIAEINIILEGYVRNNKRMRVKGFYPKYRLISSHTMRRSFCTNLYGKIPTQVIMKISGHRTETSFLTYIKKPQRHFAEQLQEYYNQKHNQLETDLK